MAVITDTKTAVEQDDQAKRDEALRRDAERLDTIAEIECMGTAYNALRNLSRPQLDRALRGRSHPRQREGAPAPLPCGP